MQGFNRAMQEYESKLTDPYGQYEDEIDYDSLLDEYADRECDEMMLEAEREETVIWDN